MSLGGQVLSSLPFVANEADARYIFSLVFVSLLYFFCICTHFVFFLYLIVMSGGVSSGTVG